jgi:putative redox protein
MATSPVHLTVAVERIANGMFTATNGRGGQIAVGAGGAGDEVQVDADKVRDTSGNRLSDIEVTFRIRFPGGEHGDDARAVLPDVVKKSHDRLCTVSRTIEIGTPITTRIE